VLQQSPFFSPRSSQPKPKSQPPPKPHPYTVGWTEGVSREGEVKREVALEKGALPNRGKVRVQAGKGGTWDATREISVPMGSKPRGAVEARLEGMIERKNRRVHGRLKSNDLRKEKEFLHATPNHRNANARGWRRETERVKHKVRRGATSTNRKHMDCASNPLTLPLRPPLSIISTITSSQMS
jgi:hypothetical protein